VCRVRLPQALHVSAGAERNGEALLPPPSSLLPTPYPLRLTHHCLLLLDRPRAFKVVPGTPSWPPSGYTEDAAFQKRGVREHAMVQAWEG